MAEKRESNRVKKQGRVLDEASRNLRIQKQVARLMNEDNHQEDPHADVNYEDEGPKFDDTFGKKKTRTKKAKKIKVRRPTINFYDALEDESVNFAKGKTNYLTAQVPPSKYPPRHFCSVCGFQSNYTCVQCGDRYCSIKCCDIHKDTRCMKFFM